MANIFTYSVYTDDDLNFGSSGGDFFFEVPTDPPTLQLHISDSDTSLRAQGSGTENALGYIFDSTTNTYQSSSSNSVRLLAVDVWEVSGGNFITIYSVEINGVNYTIIADSDQQAYGGDTATYTSDATPSSIDYDTMPSSNETLPGATGGPNLGNNDHIFGGDGDDSLRGQAGADTIEGEAGDDSLDGGAGNDSLLGGADNDSLRGQAGNDTLDGGTGNDSLDGGTGNDSLLGGAGNDSLLGAEDNDTVEGGDGDDIVYGDGSDVRDPTQDTAAFNFNRANIDASGTSDGGVSNETVGESIIYENVATTADGVIIDARFTIISITEADGITASAMQVDLNNADTNDPNIVVLNMGANTANSFGGHKAEIIVEFFAASGPDAGQPITLNGTFVFRDLDETFVGGSTTDVERVTVATSEFTSYEIADPSSVTVVDNGNSFSFSGSRDNDQTTLSALEQEENQVALDFVNRSSFTVTLTSREVNSGFTFDTENFSSATIIGDASDEGNDSVSGGAGNDTLYGSSGNDTLDGGTGDDLIDAGDDADLILLNDSFGSDTILGSEGGTDLDTLSAIGLTTNGVDAIITGYSGGNLTGTIEESGTGAVTQFSEIETLVLSNNADSYDSSAVGAITVAGLDGDDTITTGSGADTISGGAGNDLISAGQGNDSITGGTGADTFQLLDTFGRDTIAGGADADVIDASGLTTHGINVTFTGDDSGTINDQSNANGTFSGVEDFVFSDQADNVNANAITSDDRDHDLAGGDDSYTASSSTGNRNVSGGAGNDTIVGGSGDDSIDGGTGNDSLQGNAGSDTLNGGDGQDTISLFESDTATGGLNDDLFNFVAGASTGAGGDTISVTGGEDPGDVDIDTLSLAGLTNLSGDKLTKADITFGGLEDGTFTLEDGTVVTFSEIERIICFDSNARIMTPTGPRAAGQLKLGDLVVTRDHGLQPIRWIGKRTVKAAGLLAPIEFDAGVFDNRNTLRVSPQHRMLIRDSALRLSHGVDEMLVAAKHMVNGTTIRQVSGGTIEYVHLMFDRHAIIFAEGIESESFHPGEMAYDALDPAGRSELFSLFPELAVSGPQGYGPSSRETLRAWELPPRFARSA